MATIGIDFGASRLRVAVVRNGAVALLQHRYFSDRMPFAPEFSWPPERDAQWCCRITSLKRLLDFDSAFPISPQPVQSLDLLAEMLGVVRAEWESGGPEHEVHCVLAVPPCFSQRQRATLRAAGFNAGFPRVRLLDDTLAALLASRESLRGYETVLVYSWGASAFSAALYQSRGSGFRPIAQDGNRALGGDDVDAAISAAILAAWAEQTGGDLPADEAQFFQRVAAEAEAAKRTLATGRAASVALRTLLGEKTPKALRTVSLTVSPEMFSDAIAPMTSQTLRLATEVLGTGGRAKPDAVLTVGGMALLPSVKKMLEERFQAPLLHADDGGVAIGAALYGTTVAQAEWEKSDRALAEGEGKRIEGEELSPPEFAARRDAGRAGRIPRWADNFVPLLDSAQQQYEAGRLSEAMNTFEKLLAEVTRFSGELYRRAAAALDTAGRLDEAAEVLRRARRRDPSDRLIAVDLAQVCYRLAARARSARKPTEALEVVQQGMEAIQSLPRGTEAYPRLVARLLHLKGIALCDLGRLAEGVASVAESARLDQGEKLYERDLATIRAALKKPPRRRVLIPGEDRVARNAPCPCGSGRKYKRCCGRGR